MDRFSSLYTSGMNIERVKYVIWAADMDRAVAFYRDLCGGRLLKQNSVIAEVEILGSNRFRCTLPVVCDFVDGYNGGDPDDEADDFLAEIEESVMSDATTGVIEFEMSVPASSGGTTSMIARIREVSNVVNFGDPLEGRVYGRCEFEVEYERSLRDPAKH